MRIEIEIVHKKKGYKRLAKAIEALAKQVTDNQEVLMANVDQIKQELADMKVKAVAAQTKLDNITADIQGLKSAIAAGLEAQAALQAKIDELLAQGVGAATQAQLDEIGALATDAQAAWDLVDTRLGEIDEATPPLG